VSSQSQKFGERRSKQ